MDTPSPNLDFRFDIQSADEIRQGGRPIEWIWDGFIAAGNITLLTSLWKSGKTTLASVLLARMATGGAVAGRTLKAGKAVIVSEEVKSLWAMRNQRLHFANNVAFLSRPFRGPPTPEMWESLIDHLLAHRQTHGLDLVVIDPLASILPRLSESHASLMLSALTSLQRLTSQGVAVLVLHHPSKARYAEGRAARGTGALSGAVDILIEMSAFAHAAHDDRRRKLIAFSRHAATPRRLVIEMNAEMTDYAALGDDTEEAPAYWWSIVEAILADAPKGLTRQELLETWPAAQPPNRVTLWRWLDRAVAEAQLARGGTGRRANPYRYWLPEVSAPSA